MWSLHHHVCHFHRTGGYLFWAFILRAHTQKWKNFGLEMGSGKVCCKLKDAAYMSSSSLSADWPVPPCSTPFSTCVPSSGWQVSSIEAAERRGHQKDWRQSLFFSQITHSLTSHVPLCAQELRHTSAPLVIIQLWTSAPAPSHITDSSSRSSMWVEISRQVENIVLLFHLQSVSMFGGWTSRLWMILFWTSWSDFCPTSFKVMQT